MTVQTSPSRPPCHPSKDTFPTLSPPRGHHEEVFPPLLLRHQTDPPGTAPRTATGRGDRTHHGQEGAFLEAGVEGDELGLRAALASQEPAAGERKSHGYSGDRGAALGSHQQNAALSAQLVVKRRCLGPAGMRRARATRSKGG